MTYLYNLTREDKPESHKRFITLLTAGVFLICCAWVVRDHPDMVIGTLAGLLAALTGITAFSYKPNQKDK